MREPRVQHTLWDDLSRSSVDEASIENTKKKGFEQCVVVRWLSLGAQKPSLDRRIRCTSQVRPFID